MLPFYKNSLLGTPPRVLGRRLQPFSLIHAQVLEAIESPLITPGGTPSLRDLCLAVWVCQQRFPRVLENIKKPRLVRAWFWGLFSGLMMVGRWKTGQLLRFNEYLDFYSQAPERWQKAGKAAGTPRVPWPLAVHNRLTKGRYDAQAVADAWNTPVNEAMQYVAAQTDAAGDDSLVSEEEKRQALANAERAENAA